MASFHYKKYYLNLSLFQNNNAFHCSPTSLIKNLYKTRYSFFPNIDNLFQSLSDKFQMNFRANLHQNMFVMRQMRKSQNGGYKKKKHTKFSEQLTFLTSDRHINVRINDKLKIAMIRNFP